MKYWQVMIRAIFCFSVLAEALIHHSRDLHWQECPSGYSMSTYYITVTSALNAIEYPSTSVLPPSSTKSISSTSPAISSTMGAAVPSFFTSSTDSTTLSWMTASSTADTALTATSTMLPKTDTAASQSPKSTTLSTPQPNSTAPLVGGLLDGQATFYQGGDTAGTCMFTTYSLPPGIYGTALSVDNWDSALWCGACVSVTYGGNSIKAMIVNQCPGTCGLNNLDLLPNGFAKLADPTLGRIDVQWSIVECGITSPIYLQNKVGSSKWWFSMQVVNSNSPVKSLEVSTDGAKTWLSTVRRDYNFFENPSGFGVDVVDIRITSVTGEMIVINAVSTISESSTVGSSNFS